MPKINEATDTDLKVIEDLKRSGWKPGDTLLYQQEYGLTPEQQKVFEGKKGIRPDITLTDLSGNILAVFENKFEDEKKALHDGFSLISKEFSAVRITSSNYRQYKNAQIHRIVIDTLENIYQNIPSSFYDLVLVDECHRSININRKLIFDHFLCPRIGLTATPRKSIAAKGKDIFAENITQKRRITAQEIFDNPVYMRIIGTDYQEVNQKFDNRLHQVFEELQTTFKV